MSEEVRVKTAKPRTPTRRTAATDAARNGDGKVTTAPTETAEPPRTVVVPAQVAKTPAAAPRLAGQQVEIGSVLNGIYRIERSIGRGGMSEVFQAVNETDGEDRVAVKVTLPQLAGDEMTRAMFLREARALTVLTKLSHPALVQYRMVAQDKALGVLYLVTEFIDGVSLAELIGHIKPTTAELLALTRRLAEGLRAAHKAGAVHRDISPDNIMLPARRLDQAKIIDFGIVKSLTPSDKSLLGDGFAGKLGYVAPEQLGDFGREVGPWSDIYSLGLVIASLALGHDVEMGATPFEAVMRRVDGPDLSPLAPELRAVLARMLVANPADRLRAMDDVLAELDRQAIAIPAKPPGRLRLTAPPSPAVAALKPTGRSTVVLAAGLGVALVVSAAALWLLGQARRAPTPADLTAARGAASAALSGVDCAWMAPPTLAAAPAGISVKLSGVAGSPGAAAAAVTTAIGRLGMRIAGVDTAAVLAVDPPKCSLIDAFRPLRGTGAAAAQLTATQAHYPMIAGGDGHLDAHPVIDIAVPDPAADLALYGVDRDGVAEIVGSRQQLQASLGATVADMGQGHYRARPATDVEGLSGALLLTGRGPFDAALIGADAAHRDAAWRARVQQAAAAGGWRAQMVWFEVVRPKP